MNTHRGAGDASAGGSGGGVASRLAPSDLNSGIGVTNVLNDLGPACTANVATLRDTLREVSSGSPEEATIARLLFFFSELASRSTNDARGGPGTISSAGDSSISSAFVGTLTTKENDSSDGSGGGASLWNLNVVSRLFLEDFGDRDWSLIARKLDFDDFHVRDANHLGALLRLYQSSSGIVLPLDAVVSAPWHNQAGQLSLIQALLSVPSDVYTFSLNDEESNDAAIIPPNGATSSCPNPAGWACARVLQRLLVLSDVPSLVQKVRDLFVRVLIGCPEVLLCALVRLQLSVTQQAGAGGGGGGSGPDSSVNAGIQLKGELMRELIPLFFKPPTPKHSVLYGPSAIRRLWSISPTTVAAACIEAWRSTSSDTQQTRYASIIHIISIIRLLPNPNGATGTILNGNKDHEFSVAVAFVMADHELLQLRSWLAERAKANAGGTLFLVGLIAYLGKNYRAARPRVIGGAGANSPLVSMENLAQSLQFIRSLDSSILSQDIPNPLHGDRESSGIKIGDSAKALIDACLGTHPSLSGVVDRSSVAPPSTGTGGGPPPSPGSPEDVEEMANKYFQKIYTSEQGLAEVVAMLKTFKTSGNARENDIFACMIHNLFDEYRFFPKYPEKELRITGILFGMLIQHQLVSSITLGIALRYVLEALRKEPKGGATSPSGKMFRFGMFALEQFKERLHEWPQYCSHIVQIPHLKSGYAELVAEIETAMSENQNLPPSSALSSGGEEDLSDKLLQAPVTGGDAVGPSQVPPASISISQVPSSIRKKIEPAIFGEGLGRAVNDHEEVKHEAPPGAILDKVQFLINNVSMSNVDQKAKDVKNMLDPKYFGWLGSYLVVKRISTQPNFHALYLAFLDHLGEYGKGLVEAILSSVYYNVGICLRSDKITTSTTERSLLKNLGSWLGQTTLARNRPVLQIMLDCKELLFQGYETGRLIAVTPFVAKILEGAKKSVIFRPPNPWVMGLMRLFRALYEVEDLKMNIKFEIEVLCKNLGLKLDDIPLSIDELAMRAPPMKERNPDFNIKASSSGTASTSFPSEGVKTSGLSSGPSSFESKQTALASAALAAASGGNIDKGDFTSASAVLSAGGSSAPLKEQQNTVIPNLASYVTINSSLSQLLSQSPSSITESSLMRCVPVAVDRAIREIIQPVVERSVTIGCITTKEMIIKDFAMESDETKMRKAAQLMVSNLAGSLALVTCREPLRGSITTHLRELLLKNTAKESSSDGDTDQKILEQCVAICATDNLELGCMLIEKAATEKAARDIDDVLASALSARKKHREQTGQPFYDMSIFANTNQRYPSALPEQLRPQPGGLRPDQLRVYDSFQRAPRQPVFLAQQQGDSGDVVGVGSTSLQGSKEGKVVNVEALAALTTKIDNAVTGLLSAAGPRAAEITLSMLPTEHEVKRLIVATNRILPAKVSASPALSPEESDAVLGFAQGIFKRLYELSLAEPLRLEAYVGLLEVLSESLPKLKADLGTWATYAPTESEPQRKMHRTVLLLLLRSRLLTASSVDDYLANCMDRNEGSAAWVEFTILFVRTAVLEKIVSPSSLPKSVDALRNLGDGRYKNNQQVLQNYRKPVMRLLEELREAAGSTASASQQEQKSSYRDTKSYGGSGRGLSHEESSSISSESLDNLASATRCASEAVESLSRNDPQGSKQQVVFLLENWVRIYHESPGVERTLQFIQLLQQNGVGKTEAETERFFRLSTELVVETVLKNTAQGKSVRHDVVDAYASLLSSMVRHMHAGIPEGERVAQQSSLLNKVLGVTVRCMMSDFERAKRNSSSVQCRWDQRPWFRLLLNLVVDLNNPSAGSGPNKLAILKVFGSALHVAQPLVIPEFSFAWLELVSHRMFLSNMLVTHGQQGWEIAHQLLVDLFLFLEPHLRRNELTASVKEFYKGTLRVLLVLLHDFPEFLVSYHLSFCNVIPDNCVQLRNLILSAFPRGMILPDPFTPNLKIDLLPEIAQSPPVYSNITGPLGGMQTDLDEFLSSGQKKAFLAGLLPRLCKDKSNTIDAARVNSLVLYVGMKAMNRLHNSQIAHSLAHTPEMEILQKLMEFDDRGRFISLNAIANQLRYPSSHTHYYSCVMLFLFSEAKDDGVKEQVTRVLLERLIVHRPHPWGLLITFTELIKNQRYQFWNQPFTRCATEIEQVFESVAKSCIPPGASSAVVSGRGLLQ